MEQVSKEQIEQIFENLENGKFKVIRSLITGNLLKGDIIEYSFILEYAKKLNGEVRDNLYRYAKEFDLSKMTIPENESMINVKKIIEYILLEVPRINDYEKMSVQIQKSELLSRDIRQDLRQYKEVTDKHESKMERMQGEFISILSIFSAVIIAFFGGINLLGSVLTNINNASKYRLTVIVTIIGFIMFNIIYVLLYSISRLINKNIGVKRNEDKCNNCKKNITLDCIAKKYPTAFLYNGISLFIISMCTIMYFIDHYDLISYFGLYYGHASNIKAFVGIVGFVILFIIVIPLMLNLKNKIKNIFNSNCCGDSEEENNTSELTSIPSFDADIRV